MSWEQRMADRAGERALVREVESYLERQERSGEVGLFVDEPRLIGDDGPGWTISERPTR